MRRARFKLEATDGQRFNTSREATVTVTYQDARRAVVEVRPRRSRTTYTLTLEDVARIVIAKAAKAEVLG